MAFSGPGFDEFVDFPGRDFLATTIDDLLGAAVEEELTVIVE